MRRTVDEPGVAFLFTSARAGLLERAQEGLEPDTALRGLNYVPNAEAIDIADAKYPLLLVPRLLHYDFVVSSDALPLGFLVSILGRLKRRKTRWVYVAITSSALMRRHAGHQLKLFLLKRFWKSYGYIICLSQKQRKDFLSAGVRAEKLEFIPFGIDAAFYGAERNKSAVAGEGAFVLSVGRDAGRDYATLLAAARRSEHPFVIVASEKILPRSMPLPENVTVHYSLSARDVRDLYSQAGLVVVASKAEDESVGSDCSGQTVVLDALAAGKVVIATERSWITDYLVPGEDLAVVPPKDPTSLAAAIELLWQDSALAEHMARSGGDKVRSRYTTEAFARSLKQLFTRTQS